MISAEHKRDRRWMHIWFAALIMALLVGSLGLGIRDIVNVNTPVYDIHAATVRIEMVNGNIGTGFVVSSRGTVITAGHMFADTYGKIVQKSGTVVFRDGIRVQFSLSYAVCNGDQDYAFISLPEADVPYPVAPIAN